MKKRKTVFDNDFFNGEFDDLREMMDKFMNDAFPDLERMRNLKPGQPLVYGFNIRINEQGKPVINQFGNVQKGKMSEEREPLVDVINGAKEIKVIAELPGVDKDSIALKIRDNSILDITVTDPARKFAKSFSLPDKVDDSTIKASYKNGILEVTLQKLRSSAAEKRIKIE